MTTALTVTNLSKTYGEGHTAVAAVSGATLSLAENEFVALVGPSGSGKTTLLSMIGGLLTPTEGTVEIGDTRVTSLNARERTRFRSQSVGFVFQSFNLVPFLTARENLVMMAPIAGLDRRQVGKRADDLLRELGLSERSDNLPEELSGGERQRVAIGRALVTDADIILVDEPTASLDSERGAQVVQMLAEEIKGRGKTGIMVTHDTRMIGYTDRPIAISDGVLLDDRESAPA